MKKIKYTIGLPFWLIYKVFTTLVINVVTLLLLSIGAGLYTYWLLTSSTAFFEYPNLWGWQWIIFSHFHNFIIIGHWIIITLVLLLYNNRRTHVMKNS